MLFSSLASVHHLCVHSTSTTVNTEDLSQHDPGADFTKGLNPGFGLKFKTLVLNSVKNVLSQQA